MNGSKVLLDVENLQTTFRIRSGFGSAGVHKLKAVDGVSFQVRQGETFGLVGESGCGKTTVGRTILKLYQPTEGKIVYDGQDITQMDQKAFAPYRRKMQMIFQDPYTSLDPRQPVSEIIGAPLTLQ